jgi:hypothetical protein
VDGEKMGRRYVIGVVVAAILAGGFGVLAFTATPTKIRAGGDVVYDVPDWVREQARYTTMDRHAEGIVEEVYGAATTTVAKWIELEPGYASSVELTNETGDDPVYAVFVRGNWETVSSTYFATQEPNAVGVDPVNLVAGRAVLDKDGMVLTAELWDEEKPARPAFGEPFTEK